jgi:creatinine amidohydrolase/Fe(II)-dependent formamide hydrolase-like protein
MLLWYSAFGAMGNVKRGSLVALVFVLLLCSVRPVHPAAQQSPSTVYLEELTWTELRDAIHSGKTTAIIPIGGTEQSGPDIALGKHNARVRALAGMIAQGLGNAIVAPTIAYVPEGALSPPSAHMRYPGTITIPDEAFEKTLEFAARSMKQAGFQNIVFLGDHGGYQALEKAVAAKLTPEWSASGVRVIALDEYYRASTDGFEAILKTHGYTLAETGKHAGLMDTSLQMAVVPTTVRTDRLGSITPSKDGIEGDPRKSSAELGKLGVSEIVNTSIAAIRKYTAR